MDHREAELKVGRDASMDDIRELHLPEPLLVVGNLTDDVLMDTESVLEGPAEHDMIVDRSPEPDTPTIYHSLRYDNAFTYPDLFQQGDEQQRLDRRPQLFRSVVAIEPYLRSAVEFVNQFYLLLPCCGNHYPRGIEHSFACRQEQIAGLANWHFPQYQMYASCIDQPSESGGVDNYLGKISTRMEGF